MRILCKYLGLILVALSGIALACSSRNCSQLPAKFTNYQEVQLIISKTNFPFEESVRTWKSSWIDKISYYSCDGRFGFLVMKTNNRTYVHKGVPIRLWYAFKNADSFGRFYNQNLKGRFRLEVKYKK